MSCVLCVCSNQDRAPIDTRRRSNVVDFAHQASLRVGRYAVEANKKWVGVGERLSRDEDISTRNARARAHAIH